ncbi:protocatechuate-dioxygenase beta subunit protein [Penicillium fimorum]|uniref:Protocatechuate-dioxygenase beta subunit protein n=1 Tax=Penicillium fimorum TaxID=1882269 RepID=A0A9W9XPY1_9EURO|nr:protocatechuate-dioxygenase beta subunit protein [Penicillium fimorum]
MEANIYHVYRMRACGGMISTSQLYFNELLTEMIMAQKPYTSHTQIEWMANAKDMIFYQDTEEMDTILLYRLFLLTARISPRA